MRLRTIGIAALLSASLYQAGDAYIRPRGAEPPIVSATHAPRIQRTIGWTKPGALSHAGLGSWSAMWDRDTDVPLRLWGDGIVVSGSVANAAIAEAAARQFLATHIATLAPGSSVGDFTLVSNQLNGVGDLRSIGFVQRASGVRVLGGAVGFAFKADRIVMVNSTALPNVAVQIPQKRIAPSVLQANATAWLESAGQLVAARPVANLTATEPMIIPVVRPRLASGKSITYRVAEQIDVDALDGEPGSWNVWLDAATGEPIARKSTISYATGRVQMNVPVRGPQAERNAHPAAFANITVNGVATTTTLDGSITWAGTAAASVVLRLTGSFATVTNKAGTGVTQTVTVQPGGSFNWDKTAVEFDDAQLNAFIHANIAKQFAKTRLNPSLAWLGQSIPVIVNEAQSCNAFSEGDAIHFFRKNAQCENTGRLADVVYHEFGHSLHANSIIEGVGNFEGALSEGISDTLSMAITGDPGMGRGFFFSNDPLRNLNPTTPKRWPDDLHGEPHDDGEIIGGAMYSLRVALEAKLGAEAGFEKFLVLMYSAFQRASDIPTTFPEALLADDDDGNLANGTPNQCEIFAAFGKHGLADPAVTLGLAAPTRDSFSVSIHATPAVGAPVCPGLPTVASAAIDWKLRGGTVASVPMTSAGENFEGTIPTQADGNVVQYKVTLTLSDNSTISYPQNAADPFYEFFVGSVTPLYCNDFEAGIEGWTRSSDQWEFGPPQGLATDPKEAFAGASVLGMDLSADGAYDPDALEFIETPEIDLKGNTKVRLHFQRWLNVEDGFFDQARILANGVEVWSNFKSPSEPAAGIAHTDREWRFQDVDLGAQAASGKVKLRFELKSDPGLEFGGWTMDDVCIVAYDGPGPGDDGGCCSVGSDPKGAIVLSLFTLGLVVLRRRRRR